MLKLTTGFAAAISAILFFSTQSFAIDISSSQTGNINLGTNPSTIINLNNGGILNGNLTMGNSEQVANFNGGILNGTINGAGKVAILATTNLGGNIGGSTAITALNINSSAILNTSTRNITANTIEIADNGVFNYGSGTLVGKIQGERSGVGNFIFNNTKTTNFNIGQTNQLANINIIDSITITLGGNIAATTINIGNGNSGKLKSNGKNIIANNINLAQGATLEIGVGSVINGAINGNVSGNGIVQFSGSSLTQINSLGATTKLAQVLISNETTLNINDDIIFNANDITIGEGSAGETGTPVLNQNNGTIGADANSQIRLNTDSIFNYNGGIINGTVRGTSSNKGAFNINHDYTNNFEIGKSFDLALLNIAGGKTLTANANISANNIFVAGTLNLGNSSKIITGNLTTSGAGANIDLGSFGHTISGNFITANGDILKLNALSNSNIGNLKIGGNVIIADGVDLEISFDSNQGYLSDGTNFAIISAASGEINAIDDNNIDVNNLGTNQSGLLTFHTKRSNNNLLLIVDRKGAEAFTNNKSAATIYKSTDQTGSKATGELRNLQKFIDSVSTTNIQKEAALKSTIPQNNQDLNNSSFNSAKASVGVSEARLQSVLAKQNNSANIHNEEIFDSQGIWLQGFGTSANQENVVDFAGYNYSNHGLAIGIDQEIAEDLRLGISASIANADVKSTSANKRETKIDSYQFNLYGGYNFSPYFMSGILGVAVNQYNSTRVMPELGLTAGAKYGGQTYIAKFETGMIQKLNYGLIITPKISLTAAQNQIATYAESGAGTLNLHVSNEHNNFLEGRFGGDLSHDCLKILSAQIKPKIKLSYGYDFLGSSQSSRNHFQGQSSSFEIKNSNIDQVSLKYGLGFDVYIQEGVLLAADYDVEEKASYKSNSGSLYLRYDF